MTKVESVCDQFGSPSTSSHRCQNHEIVLFQAVSAKTGFGLVPKPGGFLYRVGTPAFCLILCLKPLDDSGVAFDCIARAVLIGVFLFFVSTHKFVSKQFPTSTYFQGGSNPGENQGEVNTQKLSRKVKKSLLSTPRKQQAKRLTKREEVDCNCVT